MRALSLTLILVVGMPLGCVEAAPAPGPDAYWHRRVSHFRTLPDIQDEIVLLGDSLVDGAEWGELLGNARVINRGIGSDTAWGVAARLDEVTAREPAQVFLMIGTNDLARGERSPEETAEKVGELLDTIARASPRTRVVLQSVLPVVDGRRAGVECAKVNALNALLEELAATRGVPWVDVGRDLVDERGQLVSRYTNDGLHLTGEAYELWASALLPLLDE